MSPNSLIDTELHRQWKLDRRLQCRVPNAESWRGCVGLTMLLDDPDATVYHGELGLIRNDHVRWIALRDVPPGHYPRTPRMNRRPVSLATEARAALRYGMPMIDFRREPRTTRDFRCIPFPCHRVRYGPAPWHVAEVRPGGDALDSEHAAREFAVLNRVSAGMTTFAFSATHQDGGPIRPAWAARRPSGMTPSRLQQRGANWMPRPYLAVPMDHLGALYDAATCARAQSTAYECPACRDVFDGDLFRLRTSCCTTKVGDGAFMARCPRCRRGRKWREHQGRACRVQRDVPIALRAGFCKALAAGMTLSAVGPEVYCGTPQGGGGNRPLGDLTGRPLDLVPHKLKSQIDGSNRVAWLPRASKVLAKLGQVMEAGQAWVEVMPPAPARWRQLNRRDRWLNVADVCCGTEMAIYLNRCWFEHQALRLQCEPQAALFPASLISLAATRGYLRDASLWWELSPAAMKYYEWQTGAAVFPTLPSARWDQLHFDLPGDVALEASIADPRCDATFANAHRMRGGRRLRRRLSHAVTADAA